MALPLNLNDKNIPNADFFLGILNLYIFSLIQCDWIATEKLCKKFYSVERKIKI